MSLDTSTTLSTLGTFCQPLRPFDFAQGKPRSAQKKPASLEAGLYVDLFCYTLYTTSVRCRNNHHHHNNYCSYYRDDVINATFLHKRTRVSQIYTRRFKKRTTASNFFSVFPTS